MDRAGKRRDGDWAMFVAGGRGVGQWRLLSPESAGVHLRVTKPWRVIPDATSTVIVQRVFRDNTIYDNVINPSPDPAEAEAHKTVGVFWWINCFENMIGGVGDAAPVPAFYSDHHIGDGWAGRQEDFDPARLMTGRRNASSA